MVELFLSASMTAEVEAAVCALEQAKTFEGLGAAYQIVRAETDRRSPVVAVLFIGTAILGAGLIWLTQMLGWVPRNARWTYAFGPVLFVAAAMTIVRGRAARDEVRMGRVLARWKADAES